MNIEITKTNNTTYSVNGKEVLEDFDGRIYSRFELTPSEEKALQEFISKEKENKLNTDSQA